MKEISLTMTIEEANLVLEALGNLPFTRVFSLIGKIQDQARQQLADGNAAVGTNGLDQPSLSVKG